MYLTLGVLVWAVVIAVLTASWTLFLTIPLVLAVGARGLKRAPSPLARGPRGAPQWLRQQLLARDRGRCRYCGFDVHFGVDCPNYPIGCDCDYNADHVEAWATGGSTVEANLVVSCRWCNVHKGAMDVQDFVAWLWSDEGRAALDERLKIGSQDRGRPRGDGHRPDVARRPRRRAHR